MQAGEPEHNTTGSPNSKSKSEIATWFLSFSWIFFNQFGLVYALKKTANQTWQHAPKRKLRQSEKFAGWLGKHQLDSENPKQTKQKDMDRIINPYENYWTTVYFIQCRNYEFIIYWLNMMLFINVHRWYCRVVVYRFEADEQMTLCVWCSQHFWCICAFG